MHKINISEIIKRRWNHYPINNEKLSTHDFEVIDNNVFEVAIQYQCKKCGFFACSLKTENNIIYVGDLYSCVGDLYSCDEYIIKNIIQ